MHQRCDIAYWPDINLRAGQEGNSAIQIDGETALDLVEDHTFNLLASLELLFKTDPAFFAASLVARQNSFTQSIFHPVQINLDLIADFQIGRLAGDRKLLQRHAAFHLQADINHCLILFDCDNLAFDNTAFKGF